MKDAPYPETLRYRWYHDRHVLANLVRDARNLFDSILKGLQHKISSGEKFEQRKLTTSPSLIMVVLSFCSGVSNTS